MDFSSLNPTTSNALNLAARNNEVEAVRRLLKKMNPNCIDNRGWASLHEAAANDSFESLVLILEHPECRPLAETHEGHTALYLACRHSSSLQTIKALLDSVKDIANYGSTESVTPLHVASAQGNVDVVQMLIEYGAMLDVQDFDGDTPMHDAALSSQHEAVAILLHAGADPEIKNGPSYTPFHLACCKGCYQTVQILFPFVTDINQCTSNGDTPLMLALQGCNDDIIHFLLENGADPHIKNLLCDELVLNMALTTGYNTIFKTFLDVTDKDKINRDIVLLACKPHYFKFEILEDLLSCDLGPEFFDFFESFHVTLEQIGDLRPTYLTSAPLNSYLNICEYIYNRNPQKFRDFFYLFLLRGVAVDALDVNECPPLVYIHYTAHNACFAEVFQILREHDCNIDHCSAARCNKDKCIPDAFLASLTSNPVTTPQMIPFSLHCEPGYLLEFAYENGVLGRIPPHVQSQMLSMIDGNYYLEGVTAETLSYFVPSLKHLSRLKVRSVMRNRAKGVKNTKEFLDIIDRLTLPSIVKKYLRYL